MTETEQLLNQARLREQGLVDRIRDMLQNDDGQAHKEARKALELLGYETEVENDLDHPTIRSYVETLDRLIFGPRHGRRPINNLAALKVMVESAATNYGRPILAPLPEDGREVIELVKSLMAMMNEAHQSKDKTYMAECFGKANDLYMQVENKVRELAEKKGA